MSFSSRSPTSGWDFSNGYAVSVRAEAWLRGCLSCDSNECIHMVEMTKVSAIADLMAENQGKPNSPKASQKRVCWPWGESVSRRASTPEFPRMISRRYRCNLSRCATMRRKRGWQIAFEVKDVGSDAAVRQKREELLGRVEKARDRPCCRMETRPLGDDLWWIW